MELVVREADHPRRDRPIKYSSYGNGEQEIARQALRNGGLYKGDLVSISSSPKHMRSYGVILGVDTTFITPHVKVLYENMVGSFSLKYIQAVNGVTVVEVPGQKNEYHNKKNGKA